PLSVEQLKRLEATRPRVKSEQLELAQRAWKAFGSNDPTSIKRLLDGSTSALPYLARALTRHLEEFPSSVNGLSRSEREALTAIGEGYNTPVSAFLEVAKKQESIFLGDLVFYSYLERLSDRENALVTLKDGSQVVAPSSSVSREFVESELTLTPLGREVLAGKRDWQTLNTKTRWLGGVEIAPGKGGWRWDPVERRLTSGTAKAPTTKPTRPKAKKRVKTKATKKVKANAAKPARKKKR